MIKFGMALMEMIEQLTKGFVKVTGRQPDNLEKLKIQQEAVQRFKDMNKVVDMEGNPIDTSKGIMGGKQIKDSPEDMAQGGRAGFKDGPKLTDFLNIQAAGSKTGKQQIMGAPEGITKDSEFIEAIIKLDIPFNEKAG